ncbi:EAL domain-containing protein [Paremcibacter congregatus]|uniref:EAL domain-containing protein n=1 Tax=Paremcibacter congregatus TaxID=2043170 RepID=UPI0030ECA1BD|tara:strand:+ start:8650 stop:10929 length:2280 start_codon:yes stop_codon:yes gene_type:complete
MCSKVVSVIKHKDKKTTPLSGLPEILDGLPHGVALFSHDLSLNMWNKKLTKILEIDPQNLTTKLTLTNILYIKWDEETSAQNQFASKILEELSKAETADDLFPFNYEYRLSPEKILDIKGEVIPGVGVILTFSDISLLVNQYPHISSRPALSAKSSEEHEEHNIRLLEAERDREIMEQEASKAVQMAEELALTRESAENSAKHIEAILNAINDVLVTIDPKGTILTCNNSVSKTFGYSTQDVLGKNLLFLMDSTHVASEADMEQFIVSLTSDDRFRNHTGTGHKKCGTSFPVELSVQDVLVSGHKQYTIVISDVTERHEAETLIREMALHDSLTGLANRNLLQQRLDEAMRMALRMNNKVAVMFLDLDGFKPVNDMHGHATGDKLLRIVANRLESCAREVDTVARLGGDEFAIIFTNVEETKNITRAAQRILDAVSKPIEIEDHQHQIGTSIGISFFPLDSEKPEELIRMADVALYQAKHDGKNTFCLYDSDMDSRAKAEKQIEIDLKKAINQDELVLHFQPMLDTVDYSVLGAEALIRWQHPEKGMIPPFFFIPIAENSDLMLDLGQKILEMACLQAKEWQNKGMPYFRTCVNISARQFQTKEFVDNVKCALEGAQLDPSRLELEITEGMVIGDTDAVARKLEILADMGISLAIDDFGTGYSSLAYLKRFSVHQLKIDQSFIRDITEDHDDAAITDAVIRLGHSLGLSVVAEGVETEEQVQILRQKGCDVLQGYHFSKPLPVDEFENWVLAHNEKHGI